MFADVVVNLLAALIFFVVVDIIARRILDLVGGARPRFQLTSEYRQLKDVDWPHVRVRNVGLPFSPHTRTAQDAIAYGTVDGEEIEFQWATTERAAATRESMPIYHGRPRDIPLAVRIRPGFAARFWGNQEHQIGVAYLTEAVAFCAACGARVAASSKQRMRCRSASQHAGCSQPSVAAPEIERRFAEWLRSAVVLSPAERIRVAAIVRARLDRSQDAASETKIRLAIKRLTDAFVYGGIGDADYREELHKL